MNITYGVTVNDPGLDRMTVMVRCDKSQELIAEAAGDSCQAGVQAAMHREEVGVHVGSDRRCVAVLSLWDAIRVREECSGTKDYVITVMLFDPVRQVWLEGRSRTWSTRARLL